MQEDTKHLVAWYAVGLVPLTIALLFEFATLLLVAFAIWIVTGAWYGRKKGIEHNQKQTA